MSQEEPEFNSYYLKVKTYYDEDSLSFKSRGESNPLLARIRESFREESEPLQFKHALEIGYGPGFDLVYFSGRQKAGKVYGLDISQGMQHVAKEAIQSAGLENCLAEVGSVEDIETQFPGIEFDFIYVFFGGLNTVEDLSKAANHLDRVLLPGGKMVLTFVNKWYLLGILKPLLKLKFGLAFRRLRKTWGGYSLSRFLPSKCYSPADVRKAFSRFKEVKHRGYSILFPAWYEHSKFSNRRQTERRWKWDAMLNRTPLWGCGEYTLFVFEKREK
ncbi:MAG: methyltransferase domain-containing protein [Bacteroidetes bacterium]|nr:methyltransferase domain-containing protein [Bacteroidota bacterium]